MQKKFRLLRAEEIEVKVKQATEKGAVALVYKTSRVDMDILDETVGPENWADDYREIHGNLYCGIGIRGGAGAHRILPVRFWILMEQSSMNNTKSKQPARLILCMGDGERRCASYARLFSADSARVADGHDLPVGRIQSGYDLHKYTNSKRRKRRSTVLPGCAIMAVRKQRSPRRGRDIPFAAGVLAFPRRS